MPNKVTLSADGKSATVADATATDIVTTVFSMDSALTGWYGLAQRALLVGVGGLVQKKISEDRFGIPFVRQA